MLYSGNMKFGSRLEENTIEHKIGRLWGEMSLIRNRLAHRDTYSCISINENILDINIQF